MILNSEEWFADPEFWKRYKPLMFDRDRIADSRSEAEGMISLCRPPAGGSILDMPCGEGRHSAVFTSLGYQVTGVDLDEGYLTEALKKATGGCTFVQEDMRRFCQPETFDMACNFFTSWGYFETREEDLQVARNVFESLKPGGSFLIDTEGKETAALHFKEREWFQRDGYLILLEYAADAAWTSIKNRWIFVPDNHLPGSELTEVTFTIRLYSAMELGELLCSAGFSEVQFYGSLDRRPYDHKADRLIAIAQK